MPGLTLFFVCRNFPFPFFRRLDALILLETDDPVKENLLIAGIYFWRALRSGGPQPCGVRISKGLKRAL